jgi:hypothetical protein
MFTLLLLALIVLVLLATAAFARDVATFPPTRSTVQVQMR